MISIIYSVKKYYMYIVFVHILLHLTLSNNKNSPTFFLLNIQLTFLLEHTQKGFFDNQ